MVLESFSFSFFFFWYWSLVKGGTLDKEEPGNLTCICSKLAELLFSGCETENKTGFSERLL